MKDAVKEWIKQAKDELDMALYLFQGGFLREGYAASRRTV